MKRILFFVIIALSLFVTKSHSQTEDLFNGKDLSNWNFVVDGNKAAPEDVFSVQNGVILVHGNPFGYMYTKKKYRDYTLELEWSWVDKASNSGIFLVIAEVKPGNPFPNGIECQLKAGNAGDFVMLGGSDLDEYVAPASGRPAFPVIQKREASNEKPVGTWNKAKIEVKGGKITIYINGALQNQGTNKVKEGHIGLQSEGGPVQFRNLKVTAL
ncbi:MAG: DUF1080 domain-containing protein [Tannerella sp.]|jgi:hypothetical protein|nr:DUF1080 domain-containing protein [Tannerella sp.]